MHDPTVKVRYEIVTISLVFVSFFVALPTSGVQLVFCFRGLSKFFTLVDPSALMAGSDPPECQVFGNF